MIKEEIIVKNKYGIHVHPATLIAEKSQKFQSKITIFCKEKKADASNIMSLIELSIQPEMKIRVEVSGKDEKEAFEAIQCLLEKDFF